MNPPATANEPGPARDRRDGGAGMHLTLAISSLRGGGAERVVVALAQALLDRGHRVDLLLTREGTIRYPVPDGARLFYATTDWSRSPQTMQAGGSRGGNHPWQGESFRLFDKVPTPGELLRARLRLARRLPPGIWPPLSRILRKSNNGVRTVHAIARYLEETRPDCVLASLPHCETHTLLARHLIPRPPPVVPIVHGPMQYRLKFEQQTFRYLSPTAARVVAVSDAVADSLRATVPRTADRITTIHNRVPLDDFVARASGPAPHPWLEDGGLEDGAAPVLLAVGRLEEPKNYSLLLHAFARVTRLRRCRLLILGEGNKRPILEKLIRRLRLTGCVALPGWVDNPGAAMSRAAMLVLSSNREGLPTVLLEALACGCPVVSTDTGGAREILDGSRYGELASVGNEMRFALAILHMLEEEERADPEQRRQRREERMQRAREFDSERAIEQYLALLAEVLPGGNVGHNSAP